MKKFKIGQPFILKESLKDADWYKPGIFYLKKIHPAASIEMQNTINKNINNNKFHKIYKS